MTKVILINGPARSGKDTLARAMLEEWVANIGNAVYEEHKFAEIMHTFWRDVFYTMLPYEEADDNTDGHLKSTVNPVIGIAYREGMIALSEELIKPMLGNNFFGRYTSEAIANRAEDTQVEYVALISDSGFKEEAVCVIEKFGAENVLLVKVYRPGYTYVGDSRSYINLDEFGVKTVELENVTIEQFERDGVRLIREFVEG